MFHARYEKLPSNIPHLEPKKGKRTFLLLNAVAQNLEEKILEDRTHVIKKKVTRNTECCRMVRIIREKLKRLSSSRDHVSEITNLSGTLTLEYIMT